MGALAGGGSSESEREAGNRSMVGIALSYTRIPQNEFVEPISCLVAHFVLLLAFIVAGGG